MIKSIKGTRDILPPESSGWQYMENTARKIFGLYGYREIRTPIIEETALFVKTIGEETDIVSKEMFSFTDRGERHISLRPEGTAPVIRAYLENNLDKLSQLQKLYYIGPMFRAERPQAGRMRQFHQIGVEAIGSTHPAIDAEVIKVMTDILDESGIGDYNLKINNLGCREDKKRLSENLKKTFSGKESSHLCEDCAKRIKINPLRILDCKNEKCRKSVREKFTGVEFLCDTCSDHFQEVQEFLKVLNINYQLDPYIVRGLDYYTGTVFEVTHRALGSQDAIGAGGRYDNLISDMGGAKTGACGFALGLDRMLLVLEKVSEGKAVPEAMDVFVAAMGKEAYAMAFSILDNMRNDGIACDIDYENKSLKAQMRTADRLKAKFVMIIGDEELKKGEAVVRDMVTKEQSNIAFSGLVRFVKDKII